MHKHHLEESIFKRQELQDKYLQNKQLNCLFQNINKDFFTDKCFEIQLVWRQGAVFSVKGNW